MTSIKSAENSLLLIDKDHKPLCIFGLIILLIYSILDNLIIFKSSVFEAILVCYDESLFFLEVFNKTLDSVSITLPNVIEYVFRAAES